MVEGGDLAGFNQPSTAPTGPRRPWRTYRVDKNQPQIVRALRQLGFAVQHTHDAGQGFPDTVITKHGLTIVAEIKDGTKVPSARELTPAQKRFMFSWPGMKCVLTSTDDCLKLDEQVREIASRIRAAGIKMQVTGSHDAIYQPALY